VEFSFPVSHQLSSKRNPFRFEESWWETGNENSTWTRDLTHPDKINLLSYIPFRNNQDRLGKKRKKTKQMIVSRVSDRHFFFIPNRDEGASYILIRKIALKRENWVEKDDDKKLKRTYKTTLSKNSRLTDYFALRSGRRRKVKVKWKVKREKSVTWKKCIEIEKRIKKEEFFLRKNWSQKAVV